MIEGSSAAAAVLANLWIVLRTVHVVCSQGVNHSAGESKASLLLLHRQSSKLMKKGVRRFNEGT